MLNSNAFLPDTPRIRPLNHLRVFCFACRQLGGARHDSYPPKVQAISIPARSNGDVAFDEAISVVPACVDEHVQSSTIQAEQIAVQRKQRVCRTWTMATVRPIVHALNVVEKREELDHILSSAV
jgi:hypothetical protein